LVGVSCWPGVGGRHLALATLASRLADLEAQPPSCRSWHGSSCLAWRWFNLIDPKTGEFVFWSREGGIDGTNPVDLDDLDLVAIRPLPSYVWYQDMADFIDLLSDDRAARRLGRAINGHGAFRRFRDELHEEYPELLPTWNTFNNVRAARRAVEWLRDEALISPEAADKYYADHPDPDVP
jgi:hypothetical protein